MTGQRGGAGQGSRAAEIVRVVLVLGGCAMPASLRAEGRQREIAVGFADLTAALVARHLPDSVVSPLVGAGFDALDVAERLASAGFRGRLCVVAEELADGRSVQAEIAAACPGIAVRLFTRPGGRDGAAG